MGGKCIGISFAARMVGTYTMSLSILMLNMLSTNFFSRKGDEDFFNSSRTWTIVGLNWIQNLENLNLKEKAQIAIIFFLVYDVTFLLASAYLALGSMSRKYKCAVLWLYLQMINIIDQTVALSMHLIYDHVRYDRYHSETLERPVWYIPVTSVYLLFSIYIWSVVKTAQKQWYEEQDNGNESIISNPIPTIIATNGSKTPSFLSQNFSSQPLRSPILPK